MNRTSLVLLLSVLITACSGAPQLTEPPSAVPEPASPEPASPAPASPAPASPAPTEQLPQGFYLRAWYSQPLPPEATFSWLPVLTVHEGFAIDGNVAVPLIFPGPLLILPNLRGLSDGAQASIIELAEQLGLLSGQTDFSGDGLAPGGQTAHLLLILDGVTYELVGDPLAYDGAASPEPGSPQAFALFWQQISYLEGWLETGLGPTTTYVPERLALLTMPPPEPDEHIAPNFMDWPLEDTFAELGGDFPAEGDARCLTVSGEELEVLLPVLGAANQLTIFVDADGQTRSLLARPLVPFEPSPCGDEGL